MAVEPEPKKDPYHCPKCGNYYYHMATGVHFIACPDCDTPVPDRLKETDD